MGTQGANLQAVPRARRGKSKGAKVARKRKQLIQIGDEEKMDKSFGDTGSEESEFASCVQGQAKK